MDHNLLAELNDAFAATCADAGIDSARVRIWFFDGDPLSP